MSGGHWNYQNYILGNIASDIKEIIDYNDKNNDYKKNISDDNNKIDNDWNKPDFERLYPKTVIDCMKSIYPLLKLADDAVYALDYYLSGDIGDERLIEITKKIKSMIKSKGVQNGN